MTPPTLATLSRAIEQLVVALPGVSSDIKWGSDRVFSVAGKMFCCFSAENATVLRISFKVEPQRFLELTDQTGIIPAPYLARHHWISITRADVMMTKEVLTLVRQSYQLVRAKLPKKTQASLH